MTGKEINEINLNKIVDISENDLHEKMPEILEILLLDRTTSTAKKNHNIIWANDNYKQLGNKKFGAEDEIELDLITGKFGDVIMPRALKNQEMQKSRTKSKAEVFTPTWIVKLQNDEVDKEFQQDDLETYTKRTWMEITCGEAPYMASRYEMDTGEIIPLNERVGFVDRKLARINKEVEDKAEWQRLVELAYQASYGFEWNGDSLLLARENILYTYRDYYFEKWHEEPTFGLFKQIATILSYNVFQMDGLKYIIPLSEKVVHQQVLEISLFDEDQIEFKEVVKPGKKVKIKNWEKDRMELFEKGVI